jgi:hypothetical protein
MSISMNVLVSDDISQSDYVEFLKKIGAELEDLTGVNSVLTHDNAQIWICRQDGLLEEYEEEDLISVKEKLNYSPRCLIVLELSSDVGSSGLALQFAYKFGKKWNMVVDDLYEHIYTYSEIESLYTKGSSFE